MEFCQLVRVDDPGLGHLATHRSLPSRVRSPTPAKTENNRRAACATLLISSMMTTVLPTPAPPNATGLAALECRVQSRSIDLDAGGQKHGDFRWSARPAAGAERWMGVRTGRPRRGPCSSTGSPSTPRTRGRAVCFSDRHGDGLSECRWPSHAALEPCRRWSSMAMHGANPSGRRGAAPPRAGDIDGATDAERTVKLDDSDGVVDGG